MRIKYTLIGIVIGVLFSSMAVALAGNLNPTHPPESTYSYSLADIYERLATGAAGTQRIFTEPSSGPTEPTMHTLNEIMAKAPVTHTNGATSTHVLMGKPFWGLHNSAWATRTGTMPNNGAVTIVPTTTQQMIVEGYHNGTGYVKGDANLLSGNIRSGASIYGVNGDPNVVNTSSGDAGTEHIVSGKKAWVDGSEVSGSMLNHGAVHIIPGTSIQPIPQGYHNGSGYVDTDVDLKASNIRCGITIFGVTGSIPPDCVAQTGQAGYCFSASGDIIDCTGTGQDGEHQKGCEPVVRPPQFPPPMHSWSFFGGYNRTSFTCVDGATGLEDNGDGTVTDNLTGLIWLKDANCLRGMKNWSDALAFANSLYDGWTGDPFGGDCRRLMAPAPGIGDCQISTSCEALLTQIYLLLTCQPAIRSSGSRAATGRAPRG
jgi:hypothetical protein